MPARLIRLLTSLQICLLGDLHGHRLSDFENYRGCGQTTIWALRCMIVAALHPGAQIDTTTFPIPMRFWRPVLTIDVAQAARGLKLKSLPLSARLRDVLAGMGVQTLGQLHSLPVAQLLARGRCGQKTLAELNALLRRAQAGEFASTEHAETPGRAPHVSGSWP